MHDTIKDQGLREAAGHPSKAIRALHGVDAFGLAEETFALANRVLQARQQLVRPVQPTEVTTV